MTNLDPQTTGDFWDAYLRAASAGTKHEVCSPVSGPVSHVPRIAPAAITFGWDLVVLRAPIAVSAPPKAA
jgi:hypothetical protein